MYINIDQVRTCVLIQWLYNMCFFSLVILSVNIKVSYLLRKTEKKGVFILPVARSEFVKDNFSCSQLNERNEFCNSDRLKLVIIYFQLSKYYKF